MVQFGYTFPHFESLLADVIVSLATEGMYERGVMNPTTGSGADWGGGQLPPFAPPRDDATALRFPIIG